MYEQIKVREPKVLSREQELEALQREFLAAKAAHAEATRAMIEAREKLIAFS